MKKIAFFLPTVLIILFSCNSESENKKVNDTEKNNVVATTAADTAAIDAVLQCGYENYIISDAEYEAMKKSFKEEPFKTLLNHSQIPSSHWIDACYLKNLETSISKYNSTATKKIDSFWVFLGADENRDERVQFFLLPAIGRAITPINIDNSENCIPIFTNYDNNYEKVAKPKLKRFNKKHRNEGIFNGKMIDSLSKGIRFNLCLLKAFNKLIEDNQAKNLNGIRIYHAAYKEKKAPGQIADHQTTVTFVFTKPGPGGSIIDDLEVVKKYYDRAKQLNILNTFNRGELCPQSCP